jgi:hypothetical protein
MQAGMEEIGAALFGLLVIATLGYSISAHSLAAIARKTGQSNTMEILAWIPVLQIVPALAVGGGSVGSFLLGSFAILAANAALFLTAQFVGDTLGGALVSVGLASTGLLCSAYLARICWNTAAARSLPSWFGLLVAVPGISFFVYPVMAFHDGWIHPHRLGPVIVLLLAVLSVAVPYPLIKQQLESDEGLGAEFTDWADLRESGDEEEHSDSGGKPGPGGLSDQWTTRVTESRVEGQTAAPVDSEMSIRALYALKNRFEALETMIEAASHNPADPRSHAMDLVQSIRRELSEYRGDLEPAAYQELATHLLRIETRLQTPAPSGLSSLGGIQAAQAIPEARRTDRKEAPPASAHFSNVHEAPIRPFPVNPSEACPPETRLQSRTSERGEEEWCQQPGEAGGLREGWYVRYLESGQPEQVGQYRSGLRIGVWTRFYPSGRVRAQAEFEEGLQQGWLLSFDEAGGRQKAIRFEAGSAVR